MSAKLILYYFRIDLFISLCLQWCLMGNGQATRGFPCESGAARGSFTPASAGLHDGWEVRYARVSLSQRSSLSLGMCDSIWISICYFLLCQCSFSVFCSFIMSVIRIKCMYLSICLNIYLFVYIYHCIYLSIYLSMSLFLRSFVRRGITIIRRKNT